MNRLILLVVLASTVMLPSVQADTRRDVKAKDITAIAVGGGTASVTIGGIEDADVEGVTVINGKVFIDGKEIPAHVTRHQTASGKVYLIRRSSAGVEVSELDSARGRK